MSELDSNAGASELFVVDGDSDCDQNGRDFQGGVQRYYRVFVFRDVKIDIFSPSFQI